MSLLVLVSTFVLLLLLTLAWKKSLLVSAGAALAFACLFQTAVYGFNPASLLGAGIHSSLTALEIALLVGGALSFFNGLPYRMAAACRMKRKPLR
jgi:phosphotransferase system  glucose/maltose/N-acetylglucosamine-specific IIC component